MRNTTLQKVEQNYWLDVAVWTIVTFLVFQGVAVAGSLDRRVPRQADYDRYTKISDCTVYRSALKDSQINLKEKEEALNHVLALTQESRKDLEACAKDNGLSRVETDQEESQAAFLCLESYEQWLRRGMNLEVVRQDIKSAMKDVDQLLSFLTASCPNITISSSNR